MTRKLPESGTEIRRRRRLVSPQFVRRAAFTALITANVVLIVIKGASAWRKAGV